MTSKKELIINAISEMNISLLEVLLDDNKTYQDATKETFIEKIGKVFKQFKKSKDTVLLPFSGFCNSISCENKGCKGFAFIGNVSNITMNLIFNEVDNDFEDIYRCSEFKIKDKRSKPSNTFFIDIKQDEKVKFNPPPERLEIFEECQKAFDEILKLDDGFLKKDTLLKWIDDYYWLREELDNDIYFLPFIYRSIDNFKFLYNDLNKVAYHLQFENQSFDAMADFQYINFINDIELLNWLIKYENLRNNLSKHYHPFDGRGMIEMNFLRIHKQPKIRIDLSEFVNIIQFKVIFDDYNKRMHRKYKIFTKNEIRKLDSNSEEYKNRFSLKYQLEKRGIQL